MTLRENVRYDAGMSMIAVPAARLDSIPKCRDRQRKCMLKKTDEADALNVTRKVTGCMPHATSDCFDAERGSLMVKYSIKSLDSSEFMSIFSGSVSELMVQPPTEGVKLTKLQRYRS